MSATHEYPHRAEWLRSEGMIVFTELSEMVFPKLLASVTGQQIQEHVRLGERRGDKVGTMARLLTRSYSDDFSLQRTVKEKAAPVAQSLRAYTFNGEDGDASDIMQEGISAVTNFSVNMLRAAHTQLGASYRTRDFRDAAATFRSRWYRDLAHQAAFTANGLWVNLRVVTHLVIT